ncbi:hypothetical protein ABDK56_03590 [Sphingomonas sp. ASV193]|uniref:hypothetical protein n=1 Tax=Sphingomonas sp. ASV193 TaxID=3144405 RepID=UPI0032E90F74
MDFLKLIKSFDELLYEVMSWLLFYPVTLWRVIRHPVRMIHYAENEMKRPDEERFGDALNPPLFLFLTIILLHLVELAIAGQSEVVTKTSGLYGFVRDDTTLLVLRILVFGLFPLLLARRKLKARHDRVDRDNLRQPFYAQCYATAPFAVIVSLAGFASRLGAGGEVRLSLVLLAVAFLWLGLIEIEYFRTRLDTSRGRGFVQASIAMAQGFVVLLLVAGMLD